MYQVAQDTGSLSGVIITREGLCVHYCKQYLLAKINYFKNVFLNMVKMNIMSHYDDL